MTRDHALHYDPDCEECVYLARPVAIHVPAQDPYNDPEVWSWLLRLTNHSGAPAEVKDAALVLYDWIKPLKHRIDWSNVVVDEGDEAP